MRPYQPEDIGEIVLLFYETAHSVNLRDYTPEKAEAWAPHPPSAARWHTVLRRHNTFTALEGSHVVGFGDIEAMGCLDHLFVHRGHQRRGIASALCDRLESLYPEKAVAVQASITVRGFLNGGATGPSLISRSNGAAFFWTTS
ncbi:MAG: GNAT family N-acetyltransferase [Candidatus Fimivivens sp.]|nr:GNAT family N-acetyltransferase [Candidatus Fimivivens sp.]